MLQGKIDNYIETNTVTPEVTKEVDITEDKTDFTHNTFSSIMILSRKN